MSRLKFDDCISCANRRKKHICRGCDAGEFYEDEDTPTVDRVFYEPAVRFGETVIDDESDSEEYRDLPLEGFESEDDKNDS